MLIRSRSCVAEKILGRKSATPVPGIARTSLSQPNFSRRHRESKRAKTRSDASIWGRRPRFSPQDNNPFPTNFRLIFWTLGESANAERSININISRYDSTPLLGRDFRPIALRQRGECKRRAMHLWKCLELTSCPCSLAISCICIHYIPSTLTLPQAPRPHQQQYPPKETCLLRAPALKIGFEVHSPHGCTILLRFLRSLPSDSLTAAVMRCTGMCHACPSVSHREPF